jgi:CD109 antigen
MAKEDANGLHWGDEVSIVPVEKPVPQAGGGMIARPMPFMQTPKPTDIEATGYATMALIRHGDNLNAGRAAQWLVSKRNANGGFGSTQDTVVGLQALTLYSSGARSDVNLTVTVDAGGQSRQYRITPQNFDVLQIVEVPIDSQITLNSAGTGQAVGQLVRRFSMPGSDVAQNQVLKIDVKYDVTQVSVNDLVKVTVDVVFNPPAPMEAGMTVLDISVPTGFEAVSDSVTAVMKQDGRIKRFDISGRKVIFYIENMLPGDKVHFAFSVRALYPVSAKAVPSKAYSYYQPSLSGETLGHDVVVVAK